MLDRTNNVFNGKDALPMLSLSVVPAGIELHRDKKLTDVGSMKKTADAIFPFLLAVGLDPSKVYVSQKICTLYRTNDAREIFIRFQQELFSTEEQLHLSMLMIDVFIHGGA